MDLSHVIIVRAVGAKESVQMKVSYQGEPPEHAEEELERMVRVGFHETFNHAPTRVGVGTFPYIEEEDGER